MIMMPLAFVYTHGVLKPVGYMHGNAVNILVVSFCGEEDEST